ncbi:Protein of unknown function [Dyadobacter koreensis]|uniref:Antitoxin SocA-like Panacea domain-containing protein n=1 Tax=Dyadobacter koreensis TaxID=408657 RepID=A0A1H6Z6S8_9BACT|nr:type II toxin-antitoxin system antitoxin SocA domain-containing protein [Dyadobacter koreensis]SEJ45332.1 Protein of unknown function [Dyadobacter koreensis]
MIKVKAFEYLIDGFVTWYIREKPGSDYTADFTKLKLIKLLFFVSAVNADTDNDGLLDVFDNFYALPFGHVESDVYDNLGQSAKYTVSRSRLIRNNVPEGYFDEINHLKTRLDESLLSIISKNRSLVSYSASDLVELSHQWYSWKSTFSLARSINKFSLPIDPLIIKKESKIYRLSYLV